MHDLADELPGHPSEDVVQQLKPCLEMVVVVVAAVVVVVHSAVAY